MRRAALAFLILLAHPAQADAPFKLKDLMGELAAVRASSASFTEQTTSPLLTSPVTSAGTLSYRAPDYIRKTTRTPVPEDFVLEGDRITMRGGQDGATHIFTTDQDARIGGLVEAIRATLAGNLPALTALYAVQLTGSNAAWQLQLTPQSRALARFVKCIRFAGSDGRITLISTQYGDGGNSLMRISIADAP
jgi:hypothetical protein